MEKGRCVRSAGGGMRRKREKYFHRSLFEVPGIDEVKEAGRRLGVHVYVVGGTLRDILLGKKTRDLDIAVEGSGRRFAEELGRFIVLKEEMDDYRVIRKGYFIDVIGLGERPIEEDLKRRDFTINSMGYSIFTGEFFDPLEGMKDLERKLIRANGEENIREDPLRILRGLRLGAALGFRIEDETLKLFIKHRGLLKKSAPERIHYELILMFRARCSGYIVPEVFDVIFPGFLKMRDVPKEEMDCLEHSILSLKYLEEIWDELPHSPLSQFSRKIKRNVGERLHLLKIATLLHDIGKPATMSEENGEIHFYGHEQWGGRWWEEVGENLRFSWREIEYIKRMIENHMRIHLLAAQPEVTERAIRRLVMRFGSEVMDLSLLTWADALASGNERDVVPVIKDIISYYYAMKNKPRQILMGRDLLRHFKLKPGPLIGEILSSVQAAYESGDIRTKKEALELAAKILEEKGVRIKRP
ncbi:hypothetical protein DRQ18_01030 [bacterium]|nr:MAG: hypothetical protein DRQ18_01030 [bacterium]